MAKLINDIPFGGAEDGGHTVLLTIRYEDGEQEEMKVPAEKLSNLMQSLQLAEQAAAQMRAKQPASQIELSYSHEATGVRSGRSGDQVYLRFQTKFGIPVDLSMPVSVAERTKQQIDAAMAQLQTPQSAPN